MKHATTRELFAYWDETRGERLAPERADIDPAGIRSLLGHAFVLEVDRAARFQFRLSGTRINALFLRELRGASFIDLWRSTDRAELVELLSSVLDETTPAVVGAITAPSGHRAINVELLLLPLRHLGKTHARLLGSFAADTLPSWCGLIAAEPLQLRSVRFVRAADTAIGVPTASAARAQALPAASQTGALPRVTRYNHLTVYSSR